MKKALTVASAIAIMAAVYNLAPDTKEPQSVPEAQEKPTAICYSKEEQIRLSEMVQEDITELGHQRARNLISPSNYDQAMQQLNREWDKVWSLNLCKK